jgi:hypothetical protein
MSAVDNGLMLPIKSEAWDGQTFPEEPTMFYLIMPDGFATPFDSFEDFYNDMTAFSVEQTEGGMALMPIPRDAFWSKELPEGHGILGLPTFAWFLNDRWIGYEL